MGWASMRDGMNKTILHALADGSVAYLNATGSVLVSGIEAMLEQNAERIDLAGGMVERMATITVRKSLLQPFDRKGAFVLDGKTWHIDGIAEDDGHLITLYVVP
jgi:hypothetical protein